MMIFFLLLLGTLPTQILTQQKIATNNINAGTLDEYETKVQANADSNNLTLKCFSGEIVTIPKEYLKHSNVLAQQYSKTNTIELTDTIKTQETLNQIKDALQIIHENQINPTQGLRKLLLSNAPSYFDTHIVALFTVANYLDIQPLYTIIKEHLTTMFGYEERSKTSSRYKNIVAQLPDDLQREVTSLSVKNNATLTQYILGKFTHRIIATNDHYFNMNNISPTKMGAYVVYNIHNDQAIPTLHTIDFSELGTYEFDTNPLLNVPNSKFADTPIFWSHDSSHLISMAHWKTDTFHVWDVAAKTFSEIISPSKIKRISWSPDDTLIVAACENGTVKLWDAQQRTLLYSLEGHTKAVWSAYLTKNNKKIISSGLDGAIRIWDFDKLKNTYICSNILKGHSGTVEWAQWSPDETQIVSAGADCSLRIWDTAGTLLHILAGHQGKPDWFVQISSLAWSDDGSKILSACNDQLFIWDAQSGNCLTRFLSNQGRIHSGCFINNQQIACYTMPNGWSYQGRGENKTDLHVLTFSPDNLYQLTVAEISLLEKRLTAEYMQELSGEEQALYESLPHAWHTILNKDHTAFRYE
jgi:WD40 repeat protein